MNGHQVEIIIEPLEDDAIWLLEVCEKSAVNHSNANLRSHKGFQPKICRTFNSLAKRECPYPFTISETEAKMKEIEERNAFNSRYCLPAKINGTSTEGLYLQQT